ncbi:MAG: cbb3-type cytochrome c oxidase subunit 3 [Gammaproteobacteria bacterium]|nr:cbb3-type cytochrome c oxidase subunit 3 [Gammaproteobacteria bacterium]MBU1602813.1 cbb3-type cytochrome c oxidase subunit 3 [Gammaproteobacteria bacterium]MBU2432485.1 cbb3-type cytochrome c oxidase subunit 3 [Gammaproteobacteria bacterium]MBU2448972.1 cbb3-type cytochrome c oxidase subunit 3 [Gammaproteobacteria bacterium]
MDINDLRSIVTVVGLLCFLGIVGWAYGKGSKKGFDEAANLPFAEHDDQGEASKPSHPR